MIFKTKERWISNGLFDKYIKPKIIIPRSVEKRKRESAMDKFRRKLSQNSSKANEVKK